jgi:serine protease
VQADKVTVGWHSAVVCIVDTGIAHLHPDFNPWLLNGANRTNNADGAELYWAKDVRGHGTHTAGTVNAKAGNNVGVRGMGSIELFITRGLSDGGRARESDIREALEQCETGGAKIVSLSLSGNSMSDAMKTIIDRMYSNNMLIVAAAGNGGEFKQAYPSGYDKVISVGAVSEDESIWAGSNYGPWVELVAPGDRVLSTGINGAGDYVYSVYSGTSMSTPHVAGAASILWSNFPDCSNTQIRYALAYTAKNKVVDGCDDYFGYGIIQVKDASDFLSSFSCRGAVWGQVDGDGQCSTLDVEPVNMVYKAYESKLPPGQNAAPLSTP